MEAEERYAHLKELAANIPDFGNRARANNDPKVLEWLGRLHALLDNRAFGIAAIQVSVSSDSLGTALHDGNVQSIVNSLYRAIAKVELSLPQSSRGTFIPAGNSYDAITALARILGEAKNSVLIVDPYMGPKVLQNFVIQSKEGIQVALLGAQGRVQSGFEPVAKAWIAQYGGSRPLIVRYADSKLLHDRLVSVDDQSVWDVSQSFEHLAARSPATLSKADADTAKMKIEAYTAIFDQAAELP